MRKDELVFLLINLVIMAWGNEKTHSCCLKSAALRRPCVVTWQHLRPRRAMWCLLCFPLNPPPNMAHIFAPHTHTCHETGPNVNTGPVQKGFQLGGACFVSEAPEIFGGYWLRSFAGCGIGPGSPKWRQADILANTLHPNSGNIFTCSTSRISIHLRACPQP